MTTPLPTALASAELAIAHPVWRTVYKRNIGPLWKEHQAVALEGAEQLHTLKDWMHEQVEALGKSVTAYGFRFVCSAMSIIQYVTAWSEWWITNGILTTCGDFSKVSIEQFHDGYQAPRAQRALVGDLGTRTGDLDSEAWHSARCRKKSKTVVPCPPKPHSCGQRLCGIWIWVQTSKCHGSTMRHQTWGSGSHLSIENNWNGWGHFSKEASTSPIHYFARIWIKATYSNLKYWETWGAIPAHCTTSGQGFQYQHQWGDRYQAHNFKKYHLAQGITTKLYMACGQGSCLAKRLDCLWDCGRIS